MVQRLPVWGLWPFFVVVNSVEKTVFCEIFAVLCQNFGVLDGKFGRDWHLLCSYRLPSCGAMNAQRLHCLDIGICNIEGKGGAD